MLRGRCRRYGSLPVDWIMHAFLSRCPFVQRDYTTSAPCASRFMHPAVDDTTRLLFFFLTLRLLCTH